MTHARFSIRPTLKIATAVSPTSNSRYAMNNDTNVAANAFPFDCSSD